MQVFFFPWVWINIPAQARICDVDGMLFFFVSASSVQTSWNDSRRTMIVTMFETSLNRHSANYSSIPKMILLKC